MIPSQCDPYSLHVQLSRSRSLDGIMLLSKARERHRRQHCTKQHDCSRAAVGRAQRGNGERGRIVGIVMEDIESNGKLRSWDVDSSDHWMCRTSGTSPTSAIHGPKCTLASPCTTLCASESFWGSQVIASTNWTCRQHDPGRGSDHVCTGANPSSTYV